MSEAMIIRRGGGSKGGGFDPTGAVLKVITSAGCIVDISATGYTATQLDSEGYPRADDPDIVEHYFNIPAAAFGSVSVMATNDYGMNTKTLTINTAGKVYEQFCRGLNIILNQEFGLQSGFELSSQTGTYNTQYKQFMPIMGYNYFSGSVDGIPIASYDTLTITGNCYSNHTGQVQLHDGNNAIASINVLDTSSTIYIAAIARSLSPTATLNITDCRIISAIVLG